ncbi:ATP-binding protein [Streptomyces sp. CA-249302]|uniref:ATP-binding protein n=1 Tax=Streptomyces sp. CA-249302 TaxID=3240058 RepID=UPI003D93B821
MSGTKNVRGPGNLPSDARVFIGRRDELARLAAELGQYGDGVRLLTLVGVGGVGKTRLALRAAEGAREAYPDGVWVVELSWLRPGGQLPLAVMEALRLADQTTGSVTEALCFWARDKQLLLVLDSCEHVLPDCAALVADLLASAPGLRVLATSRERLGLPGERVLEVEPLPVADADALFVQHAAAVDPAPVLDATARERVADICRILDGIPLAIELAAARLALYSLEKLHELLGERLGARFDMLAVDGGVRSRTLAGEDGGAGPGTLPDADGGARPGMLAGDDRGARPGMLAGEARGEGPPRHWTLRTTIGWSHELCAPLERLLWARLSVFAGTFTTVAATWVGAGGPLSADRVSDALMRLVQQSIVLRHPTDPERFRLLDTVREYGADWLRELGEEDAVRLRHREHYRRFAQEACADWNTSRQVAWCERVLAEHADLRAAVDGALAEPGSGVALELAGSAGFLWRNCGMPRDAQWCLDRALAVEHEPGPDLVLALWSRGAVAMNQGDLDVMRAWGERCADAAGKIGDPAMIRAAAYLTGGYLALVGRMPEAVETLAADPRLLIGMDWRGAALVMNSLGVVYSHMYGGDFEKAREAARATRTSSERCGERWSRSFVDAIVAQMDAMRGDTDAARRNCRAALTGHRLLHNTLGLAFTLDVLAEAEAGGGDGRFAARVQGVGQRIWELLGRAQMDSPQQLAARETRERTLRARLGDEAYEQAYKEGTAMSYDEGLDYALGAPEA